MSATSGTFKAGEAS